MKIIPAGKRVLLEVAIDPVLLGLPRGKEVVVHRTPDAALDDIDRLPAFDPLACPVCRDRHLATPCRYRPSPPALPSPPSRPLAGTRAQRSPQGGRERGRSAP